jgi:hypothetical protein
MVSGSTPEPTTPPAVVTTHSSGEGLRGHPNGSAPSSRRSPSSCECPGSLCRHAPQCHVTHGFRGHRPHPPPDGRPRGRQRAERHGGGARPGPAGTDRLAAARLRSGATAVVQPTPRTTALSSAAPVPATLTCRCLLDSRLSVHRHSRRTANGALRPAPRSSRGRPTRSPARPGRAATASRDAGRRGTGRRFGGARSPSAPMRGTSNDHRGA